jgi:hypothetical protein
VFLLLKAIRTYIKHLIITTTLAIVAVVYKIEIQGWTVNT